jgi:hypothetical protein
MGQPEDGHRHQRDLCLRHRAGGLLRGAQLPRHGADGRLLEKSGIDKSQYEAEAAKAFEAWSSVADIEFRQVSDPAAADILIGAQVKPVGRAFTNVSYTRAAAKAVSPLENRSSASIRSSRGRWGSTAT